MSGVIRSISLCFIIAVALAGCAEMQTTGKVVATPFTVVRDLVDAPLVSVTNVCETFARRSNPNPTPGANVGWTWRSGLNFGIGYNVSYFLFKGLSWTFGAIDYVPCRSLWPNWPRGLSPWKKPDETWGSLYFTNTRALWATPEE